MNTAGVLPTAVPAGPVAVRVNWNEPRQSIVPCTAPLTVTLSPGSQAGLLPWPETGGRFAVVETLSGTGDGVGLDETVGLGDRVGLGVTVATLVPVGVDALVGVLVRVLVAVGVLVVVGVLV